jgi:precorrin-2 methylase
MTAPGHFYGVGVGPGDPELLTLKAHRILTTSAVICAPKRNYSADGYAYSIIKGYTLSKGTSIPKSRNSSNSSSR